MDSQPFLSFWILFGYVFYEMDDKIVKSEKSMKQIFEIVYELEKLEKKRILSWNISQHVPIFWSIFLTWFRE